MKLNKENIKQIVLILTGILFMSIGYFNYIDENMNESYKPTVQKLVDIGVLRGNEKGELMLTTDMMRIFTVLDRTGVFN